MKNRRPIALLLGCVALALAAYLAPAAHADQPITEFSVSPQSTQAGGHDDVQIHFGLAQQGVGKPSLPCNCNFPKDIIVNLPTGWFGVPTNLPHCTNAQFLTGTCPTDSQIGVAYVDFLFGYVLAIYNMQPSPNQAGLIAIETPETGSPPIYTAVTPRTESDYGLEANTGGLSRLAELPGVDYILWGVPGDPIHDELRFPGDKPRRQQTCGSTAAVPQLLAGISPWRAPDGVCSNEVGEPFSTQFNGEVQPFISSPTACAVPGLSAMRVLAYDGGITTAESPFPGMTGCDLLSFNPSQSIQPTTTAADSPSGAEFVLDVPQPFSPDAPTASSLKEANVTLPAGFTVAPNLSNGKVACTDKQANIGTRLQAECPESSKIGLISVDTPLLPGPLAGAAWIGEPLPGDRYRLLFTFDGFGFHIKLPGSFILDPDTGQIRIRFADLPQAPFSRFTAHFFGAERGSLATPPRCGTYEVKSVFTPWNDALPDQTSTQFFTVDRGPAGGPCPSDPPVFDPSFEAGTADNTAGGHAPFKLDVTRRDGTQNLSGFDLTTPPGFSATLKGVPYCPQAAIERLSSQLHTGTAEQASPACGSASRIGSVATAIGAGTRPLYQNGSIYLAGPYRGAPLSFLTVIPAVSGPYDLGNVVVRAAVRVDPVTARVTTVSDTLPRILEGIPLRLRQVRFELDRKGFALNPTNCDPFSVEATVLGDQGATAQRSTHFQVANCADLPYRPRLTMRLTGGIGRRGHPAIHTMFRAGTGEANTSRVSVTLPEGELLDNSHFGAVCTRPAFAADACPPRSRIGRATVHTPLLDQPLSGGAYLRSSAHDLPDIALDLEGQIPFELALKVDSVDARLRATVESAPDVPLTSFALHLQGGAKGLLQNSEDLCARAKRATVRMIGQNGARHNAKVPLRVACGKGKRAKRDRRESR